MVEEDPVDCIDPPVTEIHGRIIAVELGHGIGRLWVEWRVLILHFFLDIAINLRAGSLGKKRWAVSVSVVLKTYHSDIHSVRGDSHYRSVPSGPFLEQGWPRAVVRSPKRQHRLYTRTLRRTIPRATARQGGRLRLAPQSATPSLDRMGLVRLRNDTGLLDCLDGGSSSWNALPNDAVPGRRRYTLC